MTLELVQPTDTQHDPLTIDHRWHDSGGVGGIRNDRHIVQTPIGSRSLGDLLTQHNDRSSTSIQPRSKPPPRTPEIEVGERMGALRHDHPNIGAKQPHQHRQVDLTDERHHYVSSVLTSCPTHRPGKGRVGQDREPSDPRRQRPTADHSHPWVDLIEVSRWSRLHNQHHVMASLGQLMREPRHHPTATTRVDPVDHQDDAHTLPSLAPRHDTQCEQAVQVTLVVHGLNGGGVARVVTWLAGRLVDEGHGAHIVARTAAEHDAYPLDDRVRVTRVAPPFRPRRLARPVRLFAFGVMARYLSWRDRSDLVVSFIAETNVVVGLMMVGSQRPHVVAESSHPLARAHEAPTLVRRLRPWLYRRAAHVVVLTEDVAAQVSEQWNLERVTAIPNPAPTITTDPPPLRDRPPLVLSVGALRDIKDHHTLIEAWARTRARQAGWELVILGEGPCRTNLEETIRRRDMTDSVSMPGWTADVLNRMASAQIFVLPSRVEGFGNVLVEAMASGCACIATDCPGGPPHILGQGQFGHLVPVGDPTAMAQAIDELVDAPTLREHLADVGRLRVRLYNEDYVYAQWRAILDIAGAA